MGTTATGTRRKGQVKATTLHKLTALQVKAAAPGKHGDGGGLYLVVAPSGASKWLFIYRSPITGKQREMGLGAAGDGAVALADARRAAAKAREWLAEGLDPIDARDAEREAAAAAQRAKAAMPTFGELTAEVIAEEAPEWRNRKHAQQWVNTMATYCAPINDKRVSDVTIDDVVAVLKPIWRSKAETAARLRGRIAKVMGVAMARKLHPGPNPALWRDNLQHLLRGPKPSERVVHHPSLPWERLPAFMAALRAKEGESIGAACLRFLILTAVRSGEARGATWREIDMNAEGGPVWTIPTERTKTKLRPHVVPLSDAAVELLARVRPLTGGAPGAVLFPSPSLRAGRLAPLSDMAWVKLLARMDAADVAAGGEGWRERVEEMTEEEEARLAVPHGFRATFRTWAGEHDAAPREVVEMALAHVVGGQTERAYSRGPLLERRRRLMQLWADYAEGREAAGVAGGSNVVSITSPKGVTA